ncbi:sulfatase-like hydrolase/transferase [Planctomycetota bacterium]
MVNVLLIHSDQHRYDCLGVNGHPQLKTPALDTLASEGMNFTHAFTPIPLCVPVRNSLMHGQWSTQHLCIANMNTEAPLPPDESLPHYSGQLRERGYFQAYVGKWHVSSRRGPKDYGFDEYVSEKAYRKWREDEGLPPIPRGNAWRVETDPGIDASQSRLGWGADRTIDVLRGAAGKEKPFFIRWDPPEPHLPNVVPEPYASMYDPADISPWPGFSDDLDGKPYIQRQQRRTWNVDGWSWDEWAPVVARYLGEISLMDTQIGRVLDELGRLGLAENTLVIYTTDHGDMCGSHGMMDKHFVMYDDVVRVPLVMRWPGRIASGTACDAFVAHAVDLATTFCEVAGADVPDTFRGESLVPLMSGEKSNGRDDIFSAYHGNQLGLYTQRMVRDRRWKYIWNATAEDELYDIENDPGELHNAATDPARADELVRLRTRLWSWMEKTDDPMVNSWIKTQLTEPFTSR